jgi:hypothetical protein
LISGAARYAWKEPIRRSLSLTMAEQTSYSEGLYTERVLR